MSDFVKQNAKILKSLNINIERLSMSTFHWFVSRNQIPKGIIWTHSEQPEPEGEQFGREIQLLKITKTDDDLLCTTTYCENSPRAIHFKNLMPHEQLYVSIVLINKYLK